MSLTDIDDYPTLANPLDFIEHVVNSNEWSWDRRNDNEMAVHVPGQWGNHSLHFSWSNDVNALQFTCAIDMRVPAERRREVNNLLVLINERMWLGHFGIWRTEELPTYRHTVLLRGADGASLAQIEDLIEFAIAECERFYPAFQYVIWGDKSADEAIDFAIIETVGEA